MAKIKDVAAYILKQTGPITAMKLQKLVYYAQAWHVTWNGRELFPEVHEAWANGPVSPVLFNAHRGKYMVASLPGGTPESLTHSERKHIDIILRDYGPLSGAALSTLSHSEPPWLDARGNLPSGAFCDTRITTKAMKKYYGSLTEENAELVADLEWPEAIQAAR